MNQNIAMKYRPNWRERLCRRLGYRYHLAELPDGIESEMPGWMMTNGSIRFSIADRIRLLFSGELRIETRHALSANVDSAVSAMSFRISDPI